MKTALKYAAAIAVTGALALAAVTPSRAEDGRNTAAIVGFGAGALVGAAVANSYNNSGYYYDSGPRYSYGPAYSYDRRNSYEPGNMYEQTYSGYGRYEPGYAYSPGYVYEPAPVYVEPAPAYTYRRAPAYTRAPVYSAPAYDSYAYAPVSRCWVSTDNTRGYGYYGSCASQNVDTDAGTLGSAKRNVAPFR